MANTFSKFFRKFFWRCHKSLYLLRKVVLVLSGLVMATALLGGVRKFTESTSHRRNVNDNNDLARLLPPPLTQPDTTVVNFPSKKVVQYC